MVHPHRDTITNLYNARETRDAALIAEAVEALFTDDATWRQPGRNCLSGTYEGKEALGGFLAALARSGNTCLDVEAAQVFADDDVGVAIEHAEATRNGDTLGWDSVLIFHFRKLRITEVAVYVSDQNLLDAFWE